MGDTAFRHYGDSDYFHLLIDGEEKDYTVEVVNDKASSISGKAYYAIWSMFLYPHERTMINIRQELIWATGDPESGDILGLGGEIFYYELSLAKKWAGVPERIEIYYDFNDKQGFSKDDTLWGIDKTLEVKPSNYKWQNQHELVWLFENTDSLEDIKITELTYYQKPDLSSILEQIIMPYTTTVFDFHFKDSSIIDGLYTANKKLYITADMKYYNLEYYEKMDLKKIRNRYEVYLILMKYYPAFLRNLIYAYHGYRFKEEPWKSLFAGCIWYKPSDNFKESDFNDYERKNIAFIQKYEQQVDEKLKDMQ